MANNDSLSVKVNRQFDCGVGKLYKAWTEESELKQWWHPLGNTLQQVKNDIKEGGEVSYIFEGNKLSISGTYKEVQDGKRLVYTWNWKLAEESITNTEYKLTVEFSGDEKTSEIRVSQENFENEESVQPHKEGWEQGLNALQEYLGGNTSGGSGGNSEAPESGYQETPEQQKVAGG